MTCHLHMLLMSEQLPTGVDHFTLIACVHFSETGTEVGVLCPSMHIYKEYINLPNTLHNVTLKSLTTIKQHATYLLSYYIIITYFQYSFFIEKDLRHCKDTIKLTYIHLNVDEYCLGLG